MAPSRPTTPPSARWPASSAPWPWASSPTLGGTDRLISAPCAPAAAVLSAFAIEMVCQGVAPGSIVLMLTVLGILTGGIQVLFGLTNIGRLIRYIPYPVVSGYLLGRGPHHHQQPDSGS